MSLDEKVKIRVIYSSNSGKVAFVTDLIAEEERTEKGKSDRKFFRGVGDNISAIDRIFSTGTDDITVYKDGEKYTYKKVRDESIVIYAGKENPLIPGKELVTIARDLEYGLVNKEPYNMKKYYDEWEKQFEDSLKEK